MPVLVRRYEQVEWEPPTAWRVPILFNAADFPVLPRHPELLPLLGRFLCSR